MAYRNLRTTGDTVLLTLQEAVRKDSLAAQDALQCLLRIASASQEGRRRALEADTMLALLTALQSERSHMLWAVRLLVALLGAPASSSKGGLCLAFAPHEWCKATSQDTGTRSAF